jgi:hypothetical protein
VASRDDQVVRHGLMDQDRGDMEQEGQEQKVYAKVSNPWLRSVVKHRSGALLAHWLFQGLLYMDPTERWFKLGLDLVLTLIAGGVLGLWLPILPATLVGFLIAHTLNFLLNGQVYGVLKHFGSVQHTWEQFDEEVQRLRQRIAEEPSIVYAAAYGSLAREQWSPTSDLDLRLVRAPGIRSAWRVCWFAVQERARAFWNRFPLDLFVLDTCASLNRMAENDRPVVLGDSERGMVG